MKHATALSAAIIAAALAAPLSHPPALAAEDNVAPTINRTFKDPELDTSRYAQSFSGESREVFTAREEVIATIGLEPGQTIADIGAGTGIYTRLFAREVGPAGEVLAVDIAPRFLTYVENWAEEEGFEQITTILGEDQSPNLPENSVDVIFSSDTYHHFEYPVTMAAEMHKALRDGGVMIVVDYERTPEREQHVRAPKSSVIAEIESVGFRLISEEHISGFSENYFLRFAKN
jgi:ubiquinone/menaquinone biosynthesis C-methylase UbiE